MSPTLNALATGLDRARIEFRHQATNPQEVWYVLFFPTIALIVMFILRDNTVPGTQFSLGAQSLPGILAMNILLNGLTGLAVAMTTDPAVTPETPAGHRQALDWCTAELPNLTAAVHTAARTGFETHAWQIAWTLVSYFDLAGHWAEWADTHETALRAARASADTVGEARTCRNLGRVRSRQGRHEEAMARLHRSLSLCRDAGDLAGQAQALRNLGGIEGRRGRYPEALDDARQALALFRAAGHRVGEGRALNQVAWWLSHLGDHRAAVEHGRESLRILQDLGDRDGEGATWDTLAHAHHHLGDHQEAITGFRHALRLRRERGDLAEIAESLDHLAATHRDAGDPAAAVLLWREALELLDRLGHPDARRLRARLRETADPLPGPGRH